MSHTPRPLQPGVYCPLLTFFHPDTEDLDISAFQTHLLHLVRAGIHPVIAGSNGEGPHLSHTERQTLITTARQTLDVAGFSHVPIIAGAGAISTRETVELCNEAESAGADYVLVITGGYFAGALKSDREALKGFYKEVAEKSKVPVLIYNYPGASGGIDLDSDIIVDLAKECPNIVGVKLTCSNVGKLTRITSVVSSPTFASAYPRKNIVSSDTPFLVLGGYSEILLSSVYGRGHGCITGLANLFPHAIAKLYTLIASSHSSVSDPSTLEKAQQLQGIIANADYIIAKAGFTGTKAILEKLRGYGGKPRRPLLLFGEVETERLWGNEYIREMIKFEGEAEVKE
ncbi:hypothetical protein BDY19DRAFT_895175 [Irpex rosettiformis]|uniref:Uncharacterized protein n=1 Tax=Irpex rosettiformis TaxID=378272 RepID=A0ACB8TVR4_9APHY|nr:hypothetical protein BDY19DRAFT_895175 [Irpex rosettiformis]